MKVTGSTIQQLDRTRPNGKPLPKSECRRWRLWATTSEGRKSRRFTGTYTQASDALKAFVSELEAFVPNSDTFGAYAQTWLGWRVESGNYSPNTTASEAMCVSALRRTALDSMRMDEVSPSDCRDALVWLKSHGAKGGELAPSTLSKMRQVLGQIMAQAVGDGLLARNPVDSVPRPKVRPAEREALSPDELQLFLNRVDDLPLDGRTMAVYLMACLGLRVGEACAIRTDEVDGRYARVSSTVRSADDTVGLPKSESGRRTVPVPQRLAAKVEEWRALRRRLGIDGSEWLCCDLDGDRMSVSAVSNWWRGGVGYEGARGKLGCRDMTLHQLRHSNLSMMARHMSPFDLQRYAGWSSIAPARIYVHDDLDAVAHAVELAWC